MASHQVNPIGLPFLIGAYFQTFKISPPEPQVLPGDVIWIQGPPKTLGPDPPYLNSFQIG